MTTRSTIPAVLSTLILLLILGLHDAAPLSAQGATMRQWQLVPAGGGDGCELSMETVERPSAGPGEVLVRIRAASLNGRDRYMFQACGDGRTPVPLSDGAGEVVEVGPGVTRFEVGDRVVGDYYAGHWIDGDRPEGARQYLRGVPGPGMLSEYVADDADGFVLVPDHLDYEEASTLPVAGLTAYVSLFKLGRMEPAEFVLLEGTGGVSTFGLLFAEAAGGRPIITSSSDEKLARATEMGAVGTVNYRRNEDWHEEVVRLTGGTGVHQVLEVGGEQTRSRALQAMAMGGHMALIGGLTGFGGTIPFDILFDRDISVTGLHVGSRKDFEDMNRFLEGHGIRPVVDRVFRFEEAPEAFDFFNNGDFMGKLVIAF